MSDIRPFVVTQNFGPLLKIAIWCLVRECFERFSTVGLIGAAWFPDIVSAEFRVDRTSHPVPFVFGLSDVICCCFLVQPFLLDLSISIFCSFAMIVFGLGMVVCFFVVVPFVVFVNLSSLRSLFGWTWGFVSMTPEGDRCVEDRELCVCWYLENPDVRRIRLPYLLPSSSIHLHEDLDQGLCHRLKFPHHHWDLVVDVVVVAVVVVVVVDVVVVVVLRALVLRWLHWEYR